MARKNPPPPPLGNTRALGNHGGRPAEYRQEFCERIIELGKAGSTATQMACELDIAKSTLYEWAKSFPEFSVAFSRARQEAQAFWETTGMVGLQAQGFNSSLYAFMMRGMFKEDWADRKEVSGPNGGPIEVKSVRDLTDEELKAELAKYGLQSPET